VTRRIYKLLSLLLFLYSIPVYLNPIDVGKSLCSLKMCQATAHICQVGPGRTAGNPFFLYCSLSSHCGLV